jgi:hypothetical protein
MGGRFAAQMGAPLTAQPIEIEALEVGMIDRREASSGSEAPGVAATGRFAAWPELARVRVTRLRRLRRLLLGPAAAYCVALQ